MNDLLSVEEKVIVLTGGAGFLGQQYKEALEQGGAKVVIFDRVAGVEEATDITEPESVRRQIEKVLRKFGRIDGLINNAAMNPAPGTAKEHWAPYEKFSLAAWNEELKVNLTGSMTVTQCMAPVMMAQRSGSIIFVASDLALIAPNNAIYEPGNFKDIAYVTSKAGILGLMRCWASYLGPYSVRANALVLGGMYRGQSPSFVEKNSALNMLGRMSEAGEYNGPMLFLCSDASSYMTGACLVVDGGRTVL